MLTIGLTGGIATGKSTVSQMFSRCGVAVFNADDAVHQLMYNQWVIDAIYNVIPHAVQSGEINRKILSDEAFYNEEVIKFLERLFHPLIHNMEYNYKNNMKKLGYSILLCDIPLLFETGSEKRFDMTVTVVCPKHVQYRRALSRMNMTEDKLENIMDRQMSQYNKIRYADYVISTGLNKAHTMQQVKSLLLNIM